MNMAAGPEPVEACIGRGGGGDRFSQLPVAHLLKLTLTLVLKLRFTRPQVETQVGNDQSLADH